MIIEQNHDWLVEECNHEKARLQAIIENPNATEHEQMVAKDMLSMYTSPIGEVEP